MHPPLVFQIFLDLSFNGREVGHHVGMGKHHTLRIGRRAGRKNNFERIGRLNINRTKALSRPSR